MEKENFKYLYSFKYNGKEYIYLTSKNYPFYLLEYNSNLDKFIYADINIFKELFVKFFNNDVLSSFDKKINFKKIKEKLHSINFNIFPLVRTTSGLLSVALVLSMCGCTQTKTENAPTTNEPSSIVEMEDKSQEIYNYFKGYNMDVIDKEYDNNDYIFVKDFINSNNKHQITIQNFEEFRKYKNIDFIPTWDDIIQAFQNNANIDEDKKNIIIDSINHLKEKEEIKGIDLSVLYSNAQRMKFQYMSSEEIQDTVNRDSAYAYFDAISGIVYLPKDKTLEKFEFIHEVLGHGTLTYREETEDCLTIFDCTNYLMLPTENRYSGYSVGVMVNEGGANMIAHLATDDYSVNTFYELYEEELRVISELCDISIGELFNNKGIALYDLMYKNGINTPVEYIFKMDGIYKGQLYCEFSDLMERLFVDATEEKIIGSNPDIQDDIINKTIQIIRNSYFKNQKELNFNYDGGSINYNFEEIENNYKKNIELLRDE